MPYANCLLPHGKRVEIVRLRMKYCQRRVYYSKSQGHNEMRRIVRSETGSVIGYNTGSAGGNTGICAFATSQEIEKYYADIEPGYCEVFNQLI